MTFHTSVVPEKRKYTFIVLCSSAKPHLPIVLCVCVFQDMEGYSGSDLRLVCKEAAMRPVRKIFDALESHQEGRTTHTYTQMLSHYIFWPQTDTFLSVLEWALHVIFLNRRHWHACHPAGNCDDSWLPGCYRTHQTFSPELDGQIHSLGERVRVCLTKRPFKHEEKYYYSPQNISDFFYCIQTAVTLSGSHSKVLFMLCYSFITYYKLTTAMWNRTGFNSLTA